MNLVTYIKILSNYVNYMYIYIHISLIVFNFPEDREGVFSSGEDGTYHMCVALRKCDRPKNDKSWLILYIMFSIFVYKIGCHKVKKKTYVISVVSLPFNKT